MPHDDSAWTAGRVTRPLCIDERPRPTVATVDALYETRRDPSVRAKADSHRGREQTPLLGIPVISGKAHAKRPEVLICYRDDYPVVVGAVS